MQVTSQYIVPWESCYRTHFSSSVNYFAKVSFGFFLLLQYEILGINLFSQDSLFGSKAMENYAFFVVTRRFIN